MKNIIKAYATDDVAEYNKECGNIKSFIARLYRYFARKPDVIITGKNINTAKHEILNIRLQSGTRVKFIEKKN